MTMSKSTHRERPPPAQSAVDDDHVLTRRTLLAGAAATAAATVGVDTPAIGQTADPDKITIFANLSAALTGIAKLKLAPDTDPVDVKQEYFKRVQDKQPAAFGKLLQIARDQNLQIPGPGTDGVVQQGDVDKLVAKIEASDDTKFLARSIVLMWYLGSWYEPDDLKKLTVDPQQFIPHTVISPTTYTQGWLWRVAQAHPMGYSELQFGYWTRNPEPIADFITVRPAKRRGN
jgi:hypothetical protein